jgi:hypothetical protein
MLVHERDEPLGFCCSEVEVPWRSVPASDADGEQSGAGAESGLPSASALIELDRVNFAMFLLRNRPRQRHNSDHAGDPANGGPRSRSVPPTPVGRLGSTWRTYFRAFSPHRIAACRLSRALIPRLHCHISCSADGRRVAGARARENSEAPSPVVRSQQGLTYQLHMSEAEAHGFAVFLAERSKVRA